MTYEDRRRRETAATPRRDPDASGPASPMSVTCERARDGLWPPEHPRLQREIERARFHVESCDACREFFAQDRALLDLWDRAPRARTPTRLRERVMDTLAAERTRGTRGRATRMAGRVAAVVLGILVAALVLRSPPPDAAAGRSGFVEDYIRRAVAGRALETTDPDRVAAFLHAELGITARPLTGRGVSVLGVEICLVDGQRGAMVSYEVRGRRLSHYLIPRSETRPAPALEPRDHVLHRLLGGARQRLHRRRLQPPRRRLRGADPGRKPPSSRRSSATSRRTS